MTISIDAVTLANTVNTTGLYTAQHTTAAGTNRGLLVIVGSTSQSPAKNVTYGGVALAQEVSNQETTTGRYGSIWSLIAPAVGTGNVIVSFSAAAAACLTIATLFGVDQADMVNSSAFSGNLTTTAALTLTGTTPDIIVGSVAFDPTSATGTVTTAIAFSLGFQTNAFIGGMVGWVTASAASKVQFSWSQSVGEVLTFVKVVGAASGGGGGGGGTTNLTVDAVTTVNTENTGLFYTAQHTCSGTNRGLIVVVGSTSQATPDSVTYNGAAMTCEGSAQETNSGKRMAIWSQIGPASGLNSLAMSFSAAAAACVQIISFSGANQTDLCTQFSSSTGSSTTPTVHVSASATDLVVDGLGWTGATATVGAQQTQEGNQSNPSLSGASSIESGSSSTAMSWTLSSSQFWVAAGVNVRAEPISATVQGATGNSISLDSVTTAQTTTTGSAYAITHTVAGTNRGLLAFIANTSQAKPYGVSYAGTALTKEGETQEVTNGKWISIWSLIAPSTGANTLAISYSAAVSAALTIISFGNVDQIDLVGDYAGAAGTTGTNATPTTTKSAGPGDLIVDALAFVGVTAAPAAGTNQTTRSNVGNAAINIATSSKPATGPSSVTWSLSQPSTWALGSVNVKPFVAKIGKVAQSMLMLDLTNPVSDLDLYTIIAGPVGPDGVAAPPVSISSGPVVVPGTGGGGVSIPPPITDTEQWKRQVSSVLQEMNMGHLDNTGVVTLTLNAASTTVPDDRVGVNAYIGLMPSTANAASELRAGLIYITCGDKQFTIAHANNAVADRTFVYSILG